ncbi:MULTISPECIES: hypothetical protein [unclassified Bacteroides]|uniref:hypothetical protein n=1 Tax=unclassified Bacteroides TaxID=2646097 RepID=UPI00168A9055|nr:MULTISPECIES: hypothetical protein [unclassified Bacteroides]MBD3588608.1 hypothetical protein [Bacteroides sp. GM023]
MKVIYVLLVCLLTLASCAETEFAEKGIGKKDITGYNDTGFYSLDGVCSFTVDNQNQTAVNSKRLTYRLQNQDQSQYIHVQFAEKPATVGQTVKATFSCRGISFLKDEMQMEVVRTDEGKIWLSGDNAGIIIPVF